MYFVKYGAYEYTLGNGDQLEHLLKPKSWAAEAVLWSVWRHRGWMKATKICESLALSPKSVSDIFHVLPKAWFLAHHYAIEFVRYLNSNDTDEDALSDVMPD